MGWGTPSGLWRAERGTIYHYQYLGEHLSTLLYLLPLLRGCVGAGGGGISPAVLHQHSSGRTGLRRWLIPSCIVFTQLFSDQGRWWKGDKGEEATLLDCLDSTDVTVTNAVTLVLVLMLCVFRIPVSNILYLCFFICIYSVSRVPWSPISAIGSLNISVEDSLTHVRMCSTTG